MSLNGNRNSILLVVIIVVSLGLLYYVFFVNKNVSEFFGKKPVQQQEVKEFKTLDPKLNEVVNNPDVEKTAVENNLAVDDEKVTVLITVKDPSFIFTPDYGTQQIRYGKYIQALVKLSKLKELAENPKIESIKAPEKASSTPPPTAPQK